MCIRTNKECPGPIDGPLIINMNAAASQKKRKRPKDISKNQDVPRFPDQIMLQLGAQIDQGAVINEAFYASFLAYFTSDGEGRDIQNRVTWLHRLPDLSTDGTNIPLTLAVRATATAYCGVETGNSAVLQSAWTFYGQALQAHAKLLRSRPKEVTVHMVSTSVMLSLFEAMQATTADAYREHINGAVKLIEATGPGQCLQGVLCQLFFHIRTQMAFVCLTTQTSTAIPIKKILEHNLEYNRLPIFQQLMTYIAKLAEFYLNKKISENWQQLMNLSEYMHLKGEVEALWLKYKDQAASRKESLSWTGDDGLRAYRDGFTALCIAYFSAARILLTVLAPRLVSSYVDLEDHHATVLDCARFLRTKRIGCAYMRMTTPLYLVSLHSAASEQRRQAISIFEDWKFSSMAGISTLALENIYKRQDVFADWKKRSMSNVGELVLDSINQYNQGSKTDEVLIRDMGKDVTSVPQLPLSKSPFEDWVGQVDSALVRDGSGQKHQNSPKTESDKRIVGVDAVTTPYLPLSSFWYEDWIGQV